MRKEIIIEERKEDPNDKTEVYILDKCEMDMLVIAEHLYLHDPMGKGKEYAFNLIGISDGSSKRIITGIGYGKVINSFAHVINPADTLDAVDEVARAKGLSIVGVAHLHPFPDGHRFLSATDMETMRAYGNLDPGHVFIVINPLTSEYTAYLWDSKNDQAVEINPIIIDTKPIIIKENGQDSKEKFLEKLLNEIKRINKIKFLPKLLFFQTLSASTIISLILISLCGNPLARILAGILSLFNISSICTIWMEMNRGPQR